MKRTPHLPVPAPLRGADVGSFAEDTIKRRLPGIAQRVLSENKLEVAATTAVQTLIYEMAHGSVRPLTDSHAPDSHAWHTAVVPYIGQDWLQIPWFFAETYFFRRLIEAVDYFASQIDPFAQQKEQSLQLPPATIGRLGQQIGRGQTEGWHDELAIQFLLDAVWGNQADLSVWHVAAANKPDHSDQAARLQHLLINDATAVAQLLGQKPANQIDFILDNVGLELLGDLALADYLLTSERCQTVCFHGKMHPTFVSDVTAVDLAYTLGFLKQQPDAAWRALAVRLAEAAANGRFVWQTHPFWTSPHPLWQLPTALYQQLAQADLLISKGDANYRRALGDAHWPYTTAVADIVSYLPVPILFLRTCKSEVLAGLPPGQEAALTAVDPAWISSGLWGLIQLVLPRP